MLASGCSETSTYNPVSPAPVNTNGAALANWTGDATVTTHSGGGGCGWGRVPGERRNAVLWRVTITADTVVLEEDLEDFPNHIVFSGRLSGSTFTASFFQGADYASYVCQFREASLTGAFSPDFSSFEGVEQLVWGTPNQETRVERRWIARRR